MDQDLNLHHDAVEAADSYLNSIPRFSKVKHSMADLRRMLSLLGAEIPEERVIHVAGTNGKGSVCAFLERILRAAGYRTALFTSPHLVRVTERFAFDGTPVSDSEFLDAFETLRTAETRFTEAGLTVPTYFEYIFLMFAVMLKRRKAPVDYVILETGLGGRLDATNCLERPRLTVITSISLDHMQYLGDTVPLIAGEKAGIMKAGVPLVHDDTVPEASAVFRARAGELGCPLVPVGRGDIRDLQLTERGISYRFTAGNGTADASCESAGAAGTGAGATDAGAGATGAAQADTELFVPFPAEYQAVNSLIAVRAAETLGVPMSAIRDGIRAARWPGRMEELCPGIYVDGAHNEGGIRAFSESAGQLIRLREAENKKRPEVTLLFDVSSDKDYETMLTTLADSVRPDRVILTSMRSYRALDLETLEAAARRVFTGSREAVLMVIPALSEAFHAAQAMNPPGGLVFCAGSLYLIGEIHSLFSHGDCPHGRRSGDGRAV